MKGVHLLFGGPTRTITDAKGKCWKFEMHPQCGPAVLNRKGDPDDNQPGPRSPFWHAVTQWAQGGHRLNGIDCVWEEEVKPVLEHIAGKHYRVIG